MSKFKNCPVIEVGDVFTRIDKKGNTWEAKVINRTEFFVDVEKKSPYKVRVGDKNGYTWHYEDVEPTIERAMIHRIYEEVEDGEEEVIGLRGKYMTKKYKRVPTARYILDLKESYVKHNNSYDFQYHITKWGDREPTPAQEGFDLFWKYMEEN